MMFQYDKLRKTWNWTVAIKQLQLVGRTKPLPIVVSGGSILKVTGCRTRPKANQGHIFMKITTWWSKHHFCVSICFYLNILTFSKNHNKNEKILHIRCHLGNFSKNQRSHSLWLWWKFLSRHAQFWLKVQPQLECSSIYILKKGKNGWLS